jgi:short-subunit dehydrogenase
MTLAAQGVAVWVVGRDRAKLDEVAESTRQAAGRVRCVQADLTIDEHIADLADQLRVESDRIDVLIHCAGAFTLGALESSAIDDFDRLYRINVRAPYLLTQVFLPALRLAKGQIVFVNSSAGRSAGFNVSQYSATKHALRAMADSLRQEVNSQGIRVLSVYPGRTATPMQALVHAMEGKEFRPESLLQPEDVAAMIVSALSLPRTAEVTDIEMRSLQKP